MEHAFLSIIILQDEFLQGESKKKKAEQILNLGPSGSMFNGRPVEPLQQINFLSLDRLFSAQVIFEDR